MLMLLSIIWQQVETEDLLVRKKKWFLFRKFHFLGTSYNPVSENFPGVPYSPLGKIIYWNEILIKFFPIIDFGDSICKSASGGIENYNDLEQVKEYFSWLVFVIEIFYIQVRNCRLVGLPDLVLSKDYVSDKIAEYMNRLISIGVAGFRIDAAKHMWPNDLNKLISKLNNLPSR